MTATGVSNYANKNVGTNKQYTVNNIQLAGQDNGNYSVITNFSDNNGAITPKTVSLAVAPKVYDASTDMTGYVSITTGVGGETLLIMVRHLMMRMLQRLINTLTL